MEVVMAHKIDQSWLQDSELQAIMRLLNEGEGEARIAGGAVRNALLEQPISDIDIATTLVPRDVILRAKAAGYKSVPTGIEHGTVTVILGKTSFEITTLREDVETDGRHAKVLYGTNWTADAQRRDLTMNALYLNADGTVFDPLGGMADVLAHNVRFIDDAETRIREDYLRILRFFRFFAWYGKFRPDADGLRACAKLKVGLASLSVERIWQELTKLFAAPQPGRAVLWMRQTGVLSTVLPETEKWGIDNLPALVEAETENSWQPDAVLRLMSILPPQEEKLSAMAERLKLPNKVRDRLAAWAATSGAQPSIKQGEFEQWLYNEDTQAVSDHIRLSIARGNGDKKKFQRQLKWLSRWQKPECPVKGRDLISIGIEPGPQISDRLQDIEKRWVESGFKLSKEDLLK